MGKEITIGPISSTKKACTDTGTVETAYLGVLQNVNAYVVNNNDLILSDNQNGHLVFRK